MIMNKCQNGKIYKIADAENTKCYIGSTISSLSKRMGKHRSDYKLYKSGLFNNISSFGLFDEFGLENCKIELIENFPCSSREELNVREGFFIQSNECVNKQVAGQTTGEWYQKNKDIIREKGLQYRLDNRDAILERKKRYREHNKDTIAEGKKKYYENNKSAISAKQKEYNDLNREEIREQNKMYRMANKDAISEKKSNTIICECGSCIRQGDFYRHKQTKQHQLYLDSCK